MSLVNLGGKCPGIDLEKNQKYQNQIYGVFRLSKPFNLTYRKIKVDDLHVDLQYYYIYIFFL